MLFKIYIKNIMDNKKFIKKINNRLALETKFENYQNYMN